MRNRKISISIIVMVLLIVQSIYAQQKTIIGIATTFDSIPISGATVKVQSTGEEVLTDSLGNFSVSCAVKDKIEVSAKGFYSQKAKLNEKTKIVAVNLSLKPGVENIEHAIGYGHVSDRDKLMAVASLNKNDVDFSKYNSMTELIKSRIPGVQVINGQFVMRGISSINSNIEPLILIDGVQANNTTLKNLQPSMVKNISFLKDAGASIYGSRAANGVIIVETKR